MVWAAWAGAFRRGDGGDSPRQKAHTRTQTPAPRQAAANKGRAPPGGRPAIPPSPPPGGGPAIPSSPTPTSARAAPRQGPRRGRPPGVKNSQKGKRRHLVLRFPHGQPRLLDLVTQLRHFGFGKNLVCLFFFVGASADFVWLSATGKPKKRLRKKSKERGGPGK